MLAFAVTVLRPAPSVSLHALPRPALPKPPTIHAPAWSAAYDGALLTGQDLSTPRPTGSTVKLLTALVVVADPSLPPTRVITVSAQEALAAAVGARRGDSELPLVPGERLTVHDLMLALLLPSGDDAADLLAAHAAGGTRAFLSRMDALALRLHLGWSRFNDPSGLSAQDRITAAGAIRLATAALKSPRIAAIVRLRTARLSDGQVLRNLNQLLFTYPGAIGMKTGYTIAAGHNLIFAARSAGATLAGSVLHEADFQTTFADAAQILDYDRRAGSARTLPAGTVVATVRWPFGLHQTLRLESPLFLGPEGAPRPRVQLGSATLLSRGGAVGTVRAAGASAAVAAAGLPRWLQIWRSL